MDATDPVQTYYDAIDDGDYDALRGVLADDFTQERPDMTHDSPDAFVSFMRDDRPRVDTCHVLDGVYAGPARGVAARGRLVAPEGPMFAFVDVFELTAAGRVSRLRSYVD
ncbi:MULTISPECIES: nuclear transport factor 2 family protein [Halobacterium]|uniref:nuclear transport factor 2 family protein n=1 Tax=Halobacterium TaxID=2239 RepID=UPI001965813B|nr:nuclear transport factor 2 family protein [Halobacterium sp. GSL-19]QRY22281.1 nuclear transport factor 2 family protein [Halobacterium sp. GSL-19]WJK63653.1 nuclear transport factor 2 family protein [Halobacterium salinarum]